MTPDGAAAPLSIRLFGGFEVLVNGQPLPRLRFRKSQAVLALLVLRQGGRCQRNGWMERERLAALLWPDSGQSKALAMGVQDLPATRLQAAGSFLRGLGQGRFRARPPEFSTVSNSALPAHKAHGDRLPNPDGSCPGGEIVL